MRRGQRLLVDDIAGGTSYRAQFQSPDQRTLVHDRAA
jgi:hypothetical protein